MRRYDDAQLDSLMRDFLRDRVDDTGGMATTSEISTAIERHIGPSPIGALSIRQLVLIGAMIALVLAAIGIATVGRRSIDLRGTVVPGPSTPCAAAPCAPPALFGGLPYHLDLPDTWVGGGPDTYAANVQWYRWNGPGGGWSAPATYPGGAGPGTPFIAFDSEGPGMRLEISGPSTVPPDTAMEREIAVWERQFDATRTCPVDRVTLPAGEGRRTCEGPDLADGYVRIVYLVVVGRDMYTLSFAYDRAVDQTDEIAALVTTFGVP